MLLIFIGGTILNVLVDEKMKNNFQFLMYRHLSSCLSCNPKIKKWLRNSAQQMKLRNKSKHKVPYGTRNCDVAKVFWLRFHDEDSLWKNTRWDGDGSHFDQYLEKYRDSLIQSNLAKASEEDYVAIDEIKNEDIPGIWQTDDEGLQSLDALVMKNMLVFEDQNGNAQVEKADKCEERRGCMRGVLCRFCFKRFFPNSCKEFRKDVNVYFDHLMSCKEASSKIRSSLEEAKETYTSTHDTKVDEIWNKLWNRMHGSNPFSKLG